MDAYSTASRAEPFSDQSPILVAGTSEAARARAVRTAEASGRRVVADVPFAGLADRLDRQALLGALWIEQDCEADDGFHHLVDRIARDSAGGRYGSVVSTSARLLDSLGPQALIGELDVIVDADEGERAAALALALSRRHQPLALSDVAADQSSARLRQLSEEVNRIAATLARLSSTAKPAPAAASAPSACEGEAPPVAADTVRAVIRARRLRNRFFADDLFADPAWDMLLDLLQAELDQLRVPVSSLCIAAAVPATTALRWLKTMVDQGLFVRRADPFDGRRVFVELAPETSQAMHRYFAEVERVPVV